MSVAKKILLIDDDDDLREGLAENLCMYDEFETTQCDTAGLGLKTAREGVFDLIILDVGLPDIDGREACRLMRNANVNIPIIMLTGADTDADAILGLDSGANDYVIKPFKFPVLLARIRAQLRQHENSADAVFYVGPYAFMPGSKCVINEKTEEKIRLTEKEVSIIKHLLKADGSPVGRGELLDQVWGYNAAVTTHTLETHIYRLRQKIEEVPSKAKIIITETGGYSISV